jgi:hypothetical protein
MTQVMASVMKTEALKHDVVAFVSSSGIAQPSMDYGFCVGQNSDGGYAVISSSSETPILVRKDEIVSVSSLDASAITAEAKSSKLKVPASAQASDLARFYASLVKASPTFLSAVSEEIESEAAL